MACGSTALSDSLKDTRVAGGSFTPNDLGTPAARVASLIPLRGRITRTQQVLPVKGRPISAPVCRAEG